MSSNLTSRAPLPSWLWVTGWLAILSLLMWPFWLIAVGIGEYYAEKGFGTWSRYNEIFSYFVQLYPLVLIPSIVTSWWLQRQEFRRPALLVALPAMVCIAIIFVASVNLALAETLAIVVTCPLPVL